MYNIFEVTIDYRLYIVAAGVKENLFCLVAQYMFE